MKSLLKKTIFILLALFLVYQTYSLIKAILITDSGQHSNGENLFIAFLFNLFITGFFAFPGFVFPTHKLIPENYYLINNESALVRCYKILGVKYFRMALMLFFWGHKKNRTKYFNGTKSGLHNLIYQTKQSEFGHLAAFIIITLCCILLLIKGHLLLCLFTLMINLIGNLYPIILQRHHRMRIGPLIERLTRQA